MNSLDWITKILVLIGALHVGLLSISSFDLIGILKVDILVTIVSVLVGFAAIWEIVKLFKK